MQCSKCQRDAIVFQSYSGLHLCGQHLIADVEAKAKKRIRTQGLLKTGDHISVVLSGDTNSSALLYFLKQLTAERRDIRISAISINKGMGDHNDRSHAKRIAELLDTECFTGSSQGEQVAVTDDIAQKTKGFSGSPYCYQHRFLLQEKVAYQHGITKIALAKSLDDAAGAVLESVLRGDVERLDGKSGPKTIPRICPFISITAAEIFLYAALCGFGEGETLSPEQGNGLHKDTIAMLDNFTSNHPATKYALLNLGENLANSPGRITGLIQACEWYGRYSQECGDDDSLREVMNGTY